MTQAPDRPYKGLTPYTEDDAFIFFGREAEREKIIANLMASRLTVLYGTSGVGKSSVLNAGVVPHLRRLAAQDPRKRFAVAVFRSWRDDPLACLAEAVRASVAAALKRRDVEPAEPDGLTRALRRWTDELEGDIFIILDQFEEYLQHYRGESGEGTLARELPRALREADLRVNFLIAIREDWYAKLDRFKGSIPRLFDNYLRIDHLGGAAALAAVEKPLEVYSKAHPEEGQWSIEPELAQEVLKRVSVSDAHRDKRDGPKPPPDELRVETPYLQLVMARLWNAEREAGSRRLRLQTLNRLGGARDIVQRHVNVLMEGLPPRQQGMASVIFEHLVTPSGIKLSHKGIDLAHFTHRELTDPEITELLNTLATPGTGILSRVAPRDDADNEVWYEITHDVLANAILHWHERYEQEQEVRRKEALAKEALARELAQTAISELNFDPERSILIALHAMSITDPPSEAAEDALHRAYLESRVRRRLVAHTGRVWAVCYDNQGTRVATASADGTARLWDVSTAEQTAVFRHDYSVQDVAFSPDGGTLATACADGTTYLWDITPEQGRRVVDCPTGCNGIVFSPDGARVATAGADGKVRVWDVASLREVLTIDAHEGRVLKVTFSRDGARLASGGEDERARVWDASTGEELFSVNAHVNGVTGIAFDCDGKQLATAGKDNFAKLWDSSGRHIATLVGHSHWVTSVTFNRDGTRLATASTDHTASLWDTRSGQVLLTLHGHTKGVAGVAFSPDEACLATAGEDYTVRIWDIAPPNPALLTLRSHSNRVVSIDFSHDSRLIATASIDNTAKLWDPSSGKELRVYKGHDADVTSVTFSPDGTRLITTSWDRTAKVWDVLSGEVLLEVRYQKPLLAASFSPSGDRFVIANTDNTARVLTSSGEELLKLEGHSAYVNTVAFSPDGKFVVTASDDNKVKLWDADSGAALQTFHGNEWFHGAAFSPDGTMIAAGCHDNRTRVWKISSGREVLNLAGHTEPVLDVAFSPDGGRLATASADRTVKVWDVSSGEELFTISDHADQVWSVVFSPDRRLLATAGWDSTARVWGAADGAYQFTLSDDNDRFTRVFSPDGVAKVYRINIEDLKRLARERVTRTLTPDECKKFLHLSHCPPDFGNR